MCHCIAPGKPVQNASVESFNGRFRDECLNEEVSARLAEACAVIEALAATTKCDRTRPVAV